jgi:hypothetical protein
VNSTKIVRGGLAGVNRQKGTSVVTFGTEPAGYLKAGVRHRASAFSFLWMPRPFVAVGGGIPFTNQPK